MVTRRFTKRRKCSSEFAGALPSGSPLIFDSPLDSLAVRYAFETTTLAESPTLLDHKAHAPALSMSFNPRDRRNPYLLTWALRGPTLFVLAYSPRLTYLSRHAGIIEDPQVRELFGKELTALREAFEVCFSSPSLSLACSALTSLFLADLEAANQDVEGGQAQAGGYQDATASQGWQAVTRPIRGDRRESHLRWQR